MNTTKKSKDLFPIKKKFETNDVSTVFMATHVQYNQRDTLFDHGASHPLQMHSDEI